MHLLVVVAIVMALAAEATVLAVGS